MFPFRRKADNVDDSPYGDSPYGEDWDGRRARRRFRRRVVLGVLTAIAVLVAAAPTIVGMTPLRDAILELALPKQAGRVACTGASFGWIAGQSLSGVRVVDADGQLLAEADSASIDRALWQLWARSKSPSLGRIRLDRPRLHVKMRRDGSNLEDFLAHFDSDESQAWSTVRLEVVDGVVNVQHASEGDAWRAGEVNVDLVISHDAWRGTGSAMIAALARDGSQASFEDRSNNGTAGAVELRIEPAAANASQVEIVADRIPLFALQPWLARTLPGAMLRGVASLDVRGTAGGWDGERMLADASGKVELGELQLSTDALRGDALAIHRGLLNFDVALKDQVLEISRLETESDWLQGAVRLQTERSALTGGPTALLAASQGSGECRFDLAKLTRMLPHALRLRTGVRVDSGDMEFAVRAAPADGKTAWTARLTVDELSGSDGRRDIRWNQPVALETLVDADGNGVQIRQASLSSPFARATMSPVMEGYRGEVQFDLEELGQHLGQFIDLADLQFRGTGQGEFALLAAAADRFHTTADVNLSQIDIRRGSEAVWREPDLRVQFDAEGKGSPASIESVTSAIVEAHGSEEHVRIELLEGYQLGSDADPWSLRIDGHGPIAAWVQRLRPIMPSTAINASGSAKATARVRLSPSVVNVVSMRCSASDLHVDTDLANVNEQRMELVGDVRWDGETRSLTSDNLEVQSSTVAARSSGLAIYLGGDGDAASMRGDVAFRANLERLTATLGIEQREGVITPQGHAVGQIRMKSDSTGSTATVEFVTQPLNLLRFVPVPGSNETQAVSVWSDTKAEGAAALAYDHSAGQLRLSSVRLTGSTMQLTGEVDVNNVATAPALQGAIDVSYDEGAAANLVASYLGPNVRVQGLNRAQLTFGDATASAAADAPLPHWSRRWRVEASSGWSAADVFGMPVGAAQVNATVADGKLGLKPLSIPVGDGSLAIHSRVLLDPGPPELQLASGQIANNITITPKVADNLLKYAAPILAGTTQTEGTFSIETGGVRIPLGQPQRADARGRLLIHRLSISPGPVVQELGRTLRQMEAIVKRNPLQNVGADRDSVRSITAADLAVDVSVFRGRVYHRNLEFYVDDVPVRSSGSVGFDESLDIVIEFPIPEKWFRDERVRRLFAGEIIQIPIKGTFSTPRVDAEAAMRRVLQILQGAAGRAAEQVIGEELNRALDRLLRPR